MELLSVYLCDPYGPGRTYQIWPFVKFFYQKLLQISMHDVTK